MSRAGEEKVASQRERESMAIERGKEKKKMEMEADW